MGKMKKKSIKKRKNRGNIVKNNKRILANHEVLKKIANESIDKN